MYEAPYLDMFFLFADDILTLADLVVLCFWCLTETSLLSDVDKARIAEESMFHDLNELKQVPGAPFSM